MPGPPSTERDSLRFLVFSASRREDSLNTKLATLAAEAIEGAGATARLCSMREFDAPSYDGDLEDDQGIPEGPGRLREELEACNGFVISSPEYNASIPGVLKNAIDWTSRYRPQPFNEKNGLLLSASPSMVGGNRGLWALRVPLEHLGARVYPDMFSLAQAHQMLGADGRITEPRLAARFADTISNFMDLAEASTHYPCVKKAWVEFLGERPDAAIDRVD